MGILLWIVFGAFVGWVASLIMKSEGGLLTDIGVGIVGSMLGGFLMNALGQGGVDGFTLYSFVVALIGAVLLIAAVRALRSR
jgi:uncharacterized membrane protein YeaQ/YmgE (transglycosylase-associated protein family)